MKRTLSTTDRLVRDEQGNLYRALVCKMSCGCRIDVDRRVLVLYGIELVERELSLHACQPALPLLPLALPA